MAKKDKKRGQRREFGVGFDEQLSMLTGRPLPVKEEKIMTDSNSDKKPYPPEVIGSPFFNPYTFIPFPDKDHEAERHKASLLTVDEIKIPVRQSSIDAENVNTETEKRRTGVIDIEVRTMSPLLTQEATPYRKFVDGKFYNAPFEKNIAEKSGHLFFKALRIGNDVIVPSTSIRGSLRTLMTILSGGTLGYIDTELFLYQRRDTQLGPVKNGDGPKKVFLAEVVNPGDSQRSGTIRLGETVLVPTKKLDELFKNYKRHGYDSLEKLRPTKGTDSYWINDPFTPTLLSKEQNPNMKWKLKLSGRKINNEPEFKVKKNNEPVLVERSLIERLMKRENVNLKDGFGEIWIDDPNAPQSVSDSKNTTHCFKVFLKKNNQNRDNRTNSDEKLEVKGIGICREGAFKPGEMEIELDTHFWAEYQGRNKNGARPELEAGDLVWLEVKNSDVSEIRPDEEIESLQWARWGRKGDRLDSLVPEHVKPDCMKNDRKVDMVTDLFGQIPMENYNLPKGKADTVSFAGRIKPYNLVFNDGGNSLLKEEITLPPLSSPKPGCIAFYRDGFPDNLDKKSDLKGYKVYRNSKERDDKSPWLFNNQGVYDEFGNLETDKYQKVNKTVELLNEGVTGRLKISFRSLSDKELALLLTACMVDWKLGGGKPLGLGHCRVMKCRVVAEDGETLKYGETLFDFKSEDGDNITLPDELKKYVSHIESRIEAYRTSQKPVKILDPASGQAVDGSLRYPRAVDKNKEKNSRGGHVWFSRHALIKHSKTGLETMGITGELKEQCKAKYKENSDQIAPQPLPVQYEQPLYGYDCITEKGGQNNTKNLVSKIEPFHPKAHIAGGERSSGFQGQNRESRKAEKENRNFKKK